MDPFTQRMLERAKARREKLDTQLSNAGHDVKRRRSPLKDANAILAQATVAKSKTSTKSPVKTLTESATPVKSPRKSAGKSDCQADIQTNKENGEIAAHSARTKLQRLGKLYSDDSNRELSSPIHRTEEKFNAEEEHVEQKPSKKGARLDRLAALASTINNWEDDLSHPTLAKPPEDKAKRIQERFNEQVRTVSVTIEPQPSTSGCSKWSKNNRDSFKEKGTVSAKQLKWDKNVLESLEAQGFSRTKSNSRLVYDYKSCSQESNTQGGGSPSKPTQSSGDHTRISPSKSSATKMIKNTGSINNTKVTESKGAHHQSSTTPEKASKNTTSTTSCTRLAPRFGYNGSPKSPAQSSPGSVLSKASLFEAKNTETKAKDPAQMTLSERMALFERNKGEAPLLPKAPLTMSIPPKKLQEKEKKNHSPGSNDVTTLKEKQKIPTKAVVAQRDKFENGSSIQELENNILRATQMERQRELDMLRSRFNRNKEMAQAAAGSCIRTSESSEGKSTSPKNSPVCPVKPTPAPEHAPPPPPPLPPQDIQEQSHSSPSKSSPVKRQGGSPPKTQKAVAICDIKRIRVAPPKPGHLYPNLSDIEATTETETETEYTINSTEAETATLDERTETESTTEAEYVIEDYGTELDSDDESEEVNTSLGRSILRAVNQQNALKKKRSIDPDPDSTTSDISVLDEMDEYLDECLAIQDAYAKSIQREEGPTPPKLNKGGKSPSCTSTSFKYTHGSVYQSPIKVVSPSSPKKNEPYIVDGDNYVPLMHSVSFYRRQQSQTPKTPVRIISRTQDIPDSIESFPSNTKDEATLVQEKVKHLLEEVCKQQTIIGQASQALNLCSSTIEFSGSREQVEGERLLLVATHRRQAALNEVQRLKVEGTLRPVIPGSPEVQESGSLTVSAITLPLRREFFRNMGTNTCLHFVCLMRHLEEIVATPVVVAEPGDSCLRFPSTLKLQDLYSDFKITVEVYSLQTQVEILPHEVKYHIHSNGSSCNSGSSVSNKKLANRTPKKFLKHESRLIMPSVQSPAGPTAVRSPAFQLSGYVIFSLKEVHRQQFTLNKVPPQSSLEGRLQMHVSCELSVSVEHRGFLTMFEDVSGFGAWHRRWCLLKGSTLSYWKYPDDERKKTPIGSLDLQSVSTTNVGLVSRDICARPNTFLLETTRSVQPGDIESLVMIRNGSETTIRHLLSADTKEDRLEWCAKLNKTLNLIHAWGGPSGSS